LRVKKTTKFLQKQEAGKARRTERILLPSDVDTGRWITDENRYREWRPESKFQRVDRQNGPTQKGRR